MEKTDDKVEFNIAEDLWLLKQYLEEAKRIKGRFVIVVNCIEDICSFEFEFDKQTEIKISENFVILTDGKYAHQIICIKKLIYLRKLEDTDTNL